MIPFAIRVFDEKKQVYLVDTFLFFGLLQVDMQRKIEMYFASYMQQRSCMPD